MKVEFRAWTRAAATAATAALVTAAVALASCSSGNDEDGASPREWTCFESGGTCDCEVLDPDALVAGPGRTEQCGAFDCCLLSEQDTQLAEATCECFDGVSSCEGEAQSRPGTSVVAECPPPGEVKPSSQACAAESQNCRSDYLQENRLSGCCEGMVCRENAEQIPVCQPGTAEELALYAECQRAPSSSDSLEVLSTLSTSVGDFEFDEVLRASHGVGPNGCFNELSLSLSGPGSTCSLNLEVAVVGGRLVTTSFSVDLQNCAGYTGPTGVLSGSLRETDPASIPFEFTFKGLACATNPGSSEDFVQITGTYCVAGEFDWHLGGQIEDVTFADQHFVLRGTLCEASPGGECPLP